MTSSVEIFKEFNTLKLIDKQNTFWIINQETQEQINISLEEWHQQVKSIKLNDSVPEIIKSEFDIARNLSLYSWFCYSFHEISKTKAFSTLEYALKKKYNIDVKLDKKSDLQKFLQKAIKEGDLKVSDFMLKDLPGLICKFKNMLPKEGETLCQNSWFTLRICAEFINQLYKKN